jgi:arginine/ornithine transport system permease protein
MLHGYLPTLLEGTGITLAVAFTSLLVAIVLGLCGAAMRLSKVAALRVLAATYTTVIRGVPDLVLMLLIFFGGQLLLNLLLAKMGVEEGIDINPFIAGVATIPPGQREAGIAFGMSPLKVFFRITFPQMIRFAIPGFTNNWLVLVKSTALVSVIGLTDMMHRAGMAAGATREPFTFYLAAGAIYLAITTVSLIALRALERRVSVGVRQAR